MSPSSLLKAISGLFRRPTAHEESSGRRRYTLVELAELAELDSDSDSDEFERVLAAAGVPPAPAHENTPIGRRKWSELGGFDRATFDYDAYIQSQQP